MKEQSNEIHKSMAAIYFLMFHAWNMYNDVSALY